MESSGNCTSYNMVFSTGSSSAADLRMNAEVLLPQGDEKRLAKVIKRSVDSDGKVFGNYNELPVLNTMLYDVQLPDDSIKPY